jgi:hypothetical protein
MKLEKDSLEEIRKLNEQRKKDEERRLAEEEEALKQLRLRNEKLLKEE